MSEPTQNRTDFSTWDRKVLEQFAREAADRIKELERDKHMLHEAWRLALKR